MPAESHGLQLTLADRSPHGVRVNPELGGQFLRDKQLLLIRRIVLHKQMLSDRSGRNAFAIRSIA